MTRKQFVETLLSETMAEAYGYIKRLEMDEDAEIVYIVCNNDYKYAVNVACDSKSGIVVDVTREANKH